jgi:hypothetical protein
MILHIMFNSISSHWGSQKWIRILADIASRGANIHAVDTSGRPMSDAAKYSGICPRASCGVPVPSPETYGTLSSQAAALGSTHLDSSIPDKQRTRTTTLGAISRACERAWSSSVRPGMIRLGRMVLYPTSTIAGRCCKGNTVHREDVKQAAERKVNIHFNVTVVHIFRLSGDGRAQG